MSFHLAKVFKLFHIHHCDSLPHLNQVKKREAKRQMLTLQKEGEGVRKVICKKKGRKEHKCGLHGM